MLLPNRHARTRAASSHTAALQLQHEFQKQPTASAQLSAAGSRAIASSTPTGNREIVSTPAGPCEIRTVQLQTRTFCGACSAQASGRRNPPVLATRLCYDCDDVGGAGSGMLCGRCYESKHPWYRTAHTVAAVLQRPQTPPPPGFIHPVTQTAIGMLESAREHGQSLARSMANDIFRVGAAVATSSSLVARVSTLLLRLRDDDFRVRDAAATRIQYMFRAWRARTRASLRAKLAWGKVVDPTTDRMFFVRRDGRPGTQPTWLAPTAFGRGLDVGYLPRILASQMTRDAAARMIQAAVKGRKSRENIARLLRGVYQRRTDAATGEVVFVNTLTGTCLPADRRSLHFLHNVMDLRDDAGGGDSTSTSSRRNSYSTGCSRPTHVRARALLILQCAWRCRLARRRLIHAATARYERVWDAASLNYFYFNTWTKQSSWVKPLARVLPKWQPNEASSISGSNGSSGGAGIEGAAAQHEHMKAVLARFSRVIHARLRVQPLVQGAYIRVYDEQYRSYFYVRRSTGASSWVKPRLLLQSRVKEVESVLPSPEAEEEGGADAAAATSGRANDTDRSVAVGRGTERPSTSSTYRDSNDNSSNDNSSNRPPSSSSRPQSRGVTASAARTTRTARAAAVVATNDVNGGSSRGDGSRGKAAGRTLVATPRSQGLDITALRLVGVGDAPTRTASAAGDGGVGDAPDSGSRLTSLVIASETRDAGAHAPSVRLLPVEGLSAASSAGGRAGAPRGGDGAGAGSGTTTHDRSSAHSSRGIVMPRLQMHEIMGHTEVHAGDGTVSLGNDTIATGALPTTSKATTTTTTTARAADEGATSSRSHAGHHRHKKSHTASEPAPASPFSKPLPLPGDNSTAGELGRQVRAAAAIAAAQSLIAPVPMPAAAASAAAHVETERELDQRVITAMGDMASPREVATTAMKRLAAATVGAVVAVATAVKTSRVAAASGAQHSSSHSSHSSSGHGSNSSAPPGSARSSTHSGGALSSQPPDAAPPGPPTPSSMRTPRPSSLAAGTAVGPPARTPRPSSRRSAEDDGRVSTSTSTASSTLSIIYTQRSSMSSSQSSSRTSRQQQQHQHRKRSTAARSRMQSPRTPWLDGEGEGGDDADVEDGTLVSSRSSARERGGGATQRDADMTQAEAQTVFAKYIETKTGAQYYVNTITGARCTVKPRALGDGEPAKILHITPADARVAEMRAIRHLQLEEMQKQAGLLPLERGAQASSISGLTALALAELSGNGQAAGALSTRRSTARSAASSIGGGGKSPAWGSLQDPEHRAITEDEAMGLGYSSSEGER